MPLTHPFLGDAPPAALLVRVLAGASPLAAVQREMQSTEPNMPYVSVRRFETLVAPELQPWRLGAAMFSIFGGLALLIAAIGLYSVLAYSVSLRAQEMVVRMALGARRVDLVLSVLSSALRVTGIALVLGRSIATAAGHWLAGMLYQTSPYEPAVLAYVVLLMVVVAALASLVPAWRATRVDPAVAMRVE